jgi:stress response protein YsnF
MQGQNLVAIFSSRSEAEAAQRRLIGAGIAASDIRLSTDETTAPSAATSTTSPRQEGGFLDWLFGEVPAEQQNWYAVNVRDGRTAVSVYVREENHERIRDVLEACDPLDIDSDDVATAGTASRGAGAQSFAEPIVGEAHPESAARIHQSARTTTGHDQVIPLAKEELDVGKRQTERRYRIRTHVVERPVEQQVHLQDERVTIERRPVSGDRAGAEVGLQGREFEVIERHEEPVVAKKSRATEEVVVHKEVKDRVETVRDSVRETKVDMDKSTGNERPGIDRAAAGSKPGISSDEPIRKI